MAKRVNRSELRVVRHRRLRARVTGTRTRPRLSVYRSLRHLHVQIIDDAKGRTLLALSTLSPELREKLAGKPLERAAQLGEELARRALAARIKRVVFDRGGHRFHGQVKALADAARAGGLEF